jgi:hypothetical protein
VIVDPLIAELVELVRLPIEVVLLVLVFDIRRTLRGHSARLLYLEARDAERSPLVARPHTGETTPIMNRRHAG